MCAPTVFLNGTVWTGDPDLPVTNRLTVADGRVASLGDADPIPPDASVVDLDAGFLMPSFGDGHAHPTFGGLEAQGPQVRGLESVDAIVAEVGRWAAEHPGEDWILGASYDPAVVSDGEFDARWLDRAVADRPVVLRAADYHTLWCNTLALRRAGVEADTPDPRLGWIVRRGDGSPMGTLREWHACDLVLDRVPRRSTDDLVAAIAEAGRTFAACGITWAQDAWVEPDMVDVYLEAERRGSLRFRVDLALRADPDRWREQRPIFADLRARVESSASELVSVRTVKFFADGVVESGTAAMLSPYADAPSSCGMQVWTPPELIEAVTAYDAAGFQVHIHAIGDAGVRTALDAVAHARAVNADWDRRPVVAHTQVVQPDDVPRMAALGVVANFEPLWAQLDPLQTVLSIPRIGQDRADLQYPIAGVIAHGAHVSFGSDWPCSPCPPLGGIQVAVTRQTFDGQPPEGWTSHQRVDLDTALHAYTAGVAYQASAENRWGMLSPGLAADLVWLERDPRTVAPLAIHSVPVHGTWLAGRRTHT